MVAAFLSYKEIKHGLLFMETGFGVDRFNCDKDYFMFVCGYTIFVYALICSEL